MSEPTGAKKMRIGSEHEFAHPDTMSEFGRKLLHSKEDCDVFFVVGPEKEKIGAHKLILKGRSPVFEVMFSSRWNEGLAQEAGREIVLENHEPSTFRSFLEYVYADMFSATAVQAVKLLHLAQYLDVQPLVKLCEEAFRKPFTTDEMIQILLAARKYKISFVENLFLRGMARNFILIGNSPAFEELDESTLILFLGRDDLCVGEAQLFSILLKWADKQIENSAEDPKPERKDVLKNMIPLVRFPTMTAKEFASVVAPTNVLPEQAVIRLFMYLSLDGVNRIEIGDSIPYIKTPRRDNRGMPCRIDLYKRISARPGDGVYPDTALRKRSNARDILTFKFNDRERITEKDLTTTIVSLVLQGPQCSEGLFRNSSRVEEMLPIKVGISLCLAATTLTHGGHHAMFPVHEEIIVEVGRDELEMTLDKPWEISCDNLYKITLRFLSDVYIVPAAFDDGSVNGRRRRKESLDLFTPAALLETIPEPSSGRIMMSELSMDSGKSDAIAGVPMGQAYLLEDSDTMSTGLHLLKALKINA